MNKPNKTPGQAVNVDAVVSLDKFHFHEIVDRCHVINSMIDDFILTHPACNTLMESYAVQAQGLISEVMVEASRQELIISKNDKTKRRAKKADALC